MAPANIKIKHHAKPSSRIVDTGIESSPGSNETLKVLVTTQGEIDDNAALQEASNYAEHYYSDIVSGKAKPLKSGNLTIYPSPKPTNPDDTFPSIRQKGRQLESKYQDLRNMILPAKDVAGGVPRAVEDFIIPKDLPSLASEGASYAVGLGPLGKLTGLGGKGVGTAASTITGRLGQEAATAAIPAAVGGVANYLGGQQDGSEAIKVAMTNTAGNFIIGRLIGSIFSKLEPRVASKFQEDIAKVFSKTSIASDIAKDDDPVNSVLQLGYHALNSNFKETAEKLINGISVSDKAHKAKTVFLDDTAKENISSNLKTAILKTRALFDSTKDDILTDGYKSIAKNLQGIVKEIDALDKLAPRERAQFVRHIFQLQDDDFRQAILSAINPNDPVQRSALASMRLHDLFDNVTGATDRLTKQQIERRQNEMWTAVTKNVKSHIYNQLDAIIRRDVEGAMIFDIFKKASKEGVLDQQLLQTYMQTRGKELSAKSETIGELVHTVFRGGKHTPDVTGTDRVNQSFISRIPGIGGIAKALAPLANHLPFIGGTNFTGSLQGVPRLPAPAAAVNTGAQIGTQRALEQRGN